MKVTLFCCLTLLLLPVQGWSHDWKKEIRSLTREGAVLVADSQGQHLYALNPHRPLIPASIIKIATASAALNYLGASYRFTTEFRLSSDNDLYVVGRGDPCLVSEELARIAHELKSKGLDRVRNILLDDRYFQRNLALHGTNRSLNPYDAYNGALCVNFNTVFVKIGPGQEVRSAEPQTPLTDSSRRSALRSGLKGKVRISLAESPELCLVYTGELLTSFLKRASILVHGKVMRVSEDSEALPLFYRHRSRWNLTEVLKRMFKYSNNFIANQVFLTLGAKRYGPPATVEKSQRVMTRFLARIGLPGVHIDEGSGLSRQTRITAAQMIKVLDRFRPHLSLLPHKDRARFKTGTLIDVKSMAGYLVKDCSQCFSFVILLNGRHFDHRTRDRIFNLIQAKFL